MARAYVSHPALVRALRSFPARVALRGEVALGIILRDRVARDGEAAWGHGSLTGDGFPVELSFTTGDERLRYTVEPASSSVPAGERLDCALRILRSLGVAVPTEVVAAFRDVQCSGPLYYGAWLGARHGADHDQYKVYVEVPTRLGSNGSAGAWRTVAQHIRAGLAGPQLPDRVVQPQILAYSPGSGSLEVYHSVEALAPQHLPRLLAHAGFEARVSELAGCLERAQGRALGAKLPGPSMGVSYAFDASSAPRCCTLFFFARSLWGPDARIRRSFAAAALALGADVERYSQVTASLERRELWKTRHGLVGLTLGPGGAFSLNIGVRPE